MQQAMLDLLRQVLPEQSANVFEGTYRHIASGGKQGLLTFGLVFMPWSGSSGFYALMEQLNVICDFKDGGRITIFGDSGGTINADCRKICAD